MQEEIEKKMDKIVNLLERINKKLELSGSFQEEIKRD